MIIFLIIYAITVIGWFVFFIVKGSFNKKHVSKWLVGFIVAMVWPLGLFFINTHRRRQKNCPKCKNMNKHYELNAHRVFGTKAFKK